MRSHLFEKIVREIKDLLDKMKIAKRNHNAFMGDIEFQDQLYAWLDYHPEAMLFCGLPAEFPIDGIQ